MLFQFQANDADIAAFTFVQGEGDKVVERRLQFNDGTTTSVWQSKSEVKGEEANNTISREVTEEKKERSQSDVLPLSTPNQKIGVVLKEKAANTTAISASQAPPTYHPLNPPPLPYPTSSPFNRQGFFLGLLKLG